MTTTSEELVAKISSIVAGPVIAFGPWLSDIAEKCVAAICVSLVTFAGHKLLLWIWSKVKK